MLLRIRLLTPNFRPSSSGETNLFSAQDGRHKSRLGVCHNSEVELNTSSKRKPCQSDWNLNFSHVFMQRRWQWGQKGLWRSQCQVIVSSKQLAAVCNSSDLHNYFPPQCHHHLLHYHAETSYCIGRGWGDKDRRKDTIVLYCESHSHSVLRLCGDWHFGGASYGSLYMDLHKSSQ